ncbi:MAG: OmpA family protein, partial [Candidatus Atribacteria bacterium]|nr:OmpA family protein [Candidatus Atribacteria bacterium]MCD6350141.1 OmpA family protein [Candidatus Atribacteria bacterium]
MPRPRRNEETPPGAPLWTQTYGDLMSLLLCFFVLLFALSTIDVARFKEIISSIQGALGVLEGGPRVLQPSDIPVPKPPTQINPSGLVELKLAGLKREIEKKLIEEKAISPEKVNVKIDERGLVITFLDNVFFDLGSADLKPEMIPVLHAVADILKEIDNSVRIEGHTCDLPIHTPRFPSNWELSAGRAIAVLRYFVEKEGIPPERWIVLGYAYYRTQVPKMNE